MFRHLLLPAFLAVVVSAPAAGPDTAVLDRWIARQAAIRSLSADFTQTRALRVLRNPVAAKGRLWFQAPGSFRWEVGAPPKTIVLRQDDDIRVIEPPKKQVKIEAAKIGQREAGLMEFPFVRSREDLEKRFEILDLRTADGICRVKLAPRDTQGFLTGIQLVFDTSSYHLLSLEMTFRDGSSMRNEFSNVQVNEKLPAGTFAFDTAGFEVIDAGR
jgi:outer membrane lipoprotein carrier protein